MRIALAATFAFLVSLVAFPSVASAQGAITGVVKDASGAVLPGVTVEASSPDLIEKARTATTDDSGRYRIVDLRAGTYTVAFALPGFSTVREDVIAPQVQVEQPRPVNTSTPDRAARVSSQEKS